MEFSVQKGNIEEQQCDLLIATHFEDQEQFTGALKAADKAIDGFLTQVLKEDQFEGKSGQSLLVHTHDKLPATRVLVLGLGKKEECTTETLRRVAATAVRTAKTVKAKSIVASLDGLPAKIAGEDGAQAFTEGISLGAYTFSKYKDTEQTKKSANTVQKVTLLTTNAKQTKALRAGATRGQQYAAGAMLTRDMVNEPALHMKPKDVVKAAEKIAKAHSELRIKVYTEAEIRKMKMGSFLSVAAGSDESPYFIHLTYKPKTKKKNLKKVALCGKGITFDSGGLSLKPTTHMGDMKMDMAGAAVVLGVFSQLANTKPQMEVHGVLPVTENMVSGSATRPGDVVTAYNGKTIEITNTDAEGRLILADALAWSEDKLKPDYLIDVATLTGAAMVSLGMHMSAAFGSDDELTKAFLKASQHTGEQSWEMPITPEYSKLMESPVADLQNSHKSPFAGAAQGAVFLKAFVKDTPWLHLDIAGPAFTEAPLFPYTTHGATGYGVRSLLHVLDQLS